jgi:hypothetical protein
VSGILVSARLRASWLPASVFVLAFVACRSHGEGSEAARGEAGRVAHAIQNVRNAERGDRGPLIAALHATNCTAADVCKARDDCVNAYGVEAAALDGVRAVRRSAENSADPVPSAAIDVLAKSKTEIERARGLEDACADLEAGLESAYSL